MSNLDDLQRRLGLEFRDRRLLHTAFVHSSYLNENPSAASESNERLEFLGDAVVGLVVADDLYRRFPERSEGLLTQMRIHVVQGETLARVARSLELGEHLVLGVGEEASGGRERDSSMAGLFEALVGAVYLDQGYHDAARFVLGVLDAELADSERIGHIKNPKSALQELLQGRGIPAPSYRITETKGKDHAREFTVVVLVDGKVMGEGKGRRKSLAEQEAAAYALDALSGEP
jgi:ribonuclease-3